MKQVLVTGATGFIGRHLCQQLVARGFKVRGVVRPQSADAPLPPQVEPVLLPEVGPCTDWRESLHNVQYVIHLAAKAEMGEAEQTSPRSESYHKVNVAGTRCLAEAAAAEGVERFLLASSVKAMAEATGLTVPLTEAMECAPMDPYGISKLQSEAALREVCSQTAMQGVVFRLPLVYGAGVRANMLKLMLLVDRGIPLPLAMAKNKRSFIFVGNLGDVFIKSLSHSAAAGQTFLVSDNDDLSTPDLIRLLAKELGRRSLLVPVPQALLQAGAKVADAARRLIGRSEDHWLPMMARLTDSFVLDPSHCIRTLGWQPPFSVREGIARTVAWFRTRDRVETL